MRFEGPSILGIRRGKNMEDLTVVLVITMLIAGADAKTDSPDVSALNVMYSSMNSPSKLTGWQSSGGDPCGDNWYGIECSGSSVTKIKLMGLDLSGSLGYQLSSLTSVTYFDMSENKLNGEIPYQLPPNAVHIDLSENKFTGNVPYSISQMLDLKFLNLGHNQLKGQLIDMFGKLSKLQTLDLSSNELSGNLPQSFVSLSSLSKLRLQKNEFTGTINVLAKLKLNDLNVADNHFTGWIPSNLKKINNLNTDGNSWSSGPAPPGSEDAGGGGIGNSGLSAVAITIIILSVLVALALVITLFTKKSSSPSSHFLDEERASQRRQFTPLSSQELTHDMMPAPRKSFKDLDPASLSVSIDMKGLQKSPSIGNRNLQSDTKSSLSDSEFASRLNARRSTSFRSVSYALADLQSATANFATGRLIGEGTIGRVYKAKYADGKVLAVKKIESSLFQGRKPEEFSEIVTKISALHHPNITELYGYCSEQGHNMLIYEYFRNGSLHEFLHLSDDFSKPLTWNTRVRIALGTAKAIEYLHEVCSPSITHKNIKSSNIFLDMEFNPRLSDCGLGTFHQRTSQNLGAGYNAPECTKPSAYTLKSDVYSFGVVMLELLTGRMPFNSSKPRPEQCLVRWATPQLHEIDALERMVDPALRGLYPPKSVSRFADTIALCVQAEPDFRPPMSEVVQALVRLVQRSSMNKRGESPGSSGRMDDFDY
ncbi:hypothetical protein MLD38_028520 [Melastoma candidum]|uniref:Uncharacterized protein n=1 Tax=Melastoma candidum TaxID=119954 RepID=A0ACB9N3H3_9MYRT|nr:hypothetical protein MLD38_028520 [Melastoma candidum]